MNRPALIEIEKFVPRASIDRLYWASPYHLVPNGKTGIEAFAVIREAMKKTGMVAMGRLVMSTRERVCAIEIEEDAEKIVAPQSGEFDPSEFDGRYEDALHNLIEQTKKGRPVKSSKPREANDANAIDLMAALKRSLQGDGPVERRKPTPAKAKKAANTKWRKGRAA